MTRIDGNYQVSAYKGVLTKETVVKSCIKIKQTFPALTTDFFDILSERITENKFSDERLKASVNHVIDNCVYLQPTIAQFLSYDKKIKLYTYEDLFLSSDDLRRIAHNYQKVKVFEGQKKPMWAHINDIERYKLESWIPIAK